MVMHSEEGGIHEETFGLAKGFTAVVVKLGIVTTRPEQIIDAEEVRLFTVGILKDAMLKGWLMKCELFVAEDEVIQYNPN